jgi:hypothetical protein
VSSHVRAVKQASSLQVSTVILTLKKEIDMHAEKYSQNGVLGKRGDGCAEMSEAHRVR